MLIAAMNIYFITTGKDSDLYSIEIGDKLDQSSALVTVNSPTSSLVTFSSNERPYTILLSDNVPVTVTDYLLPHLMPQLDLSEIEYRRDFNYFGSDEPIYLLSGSSIQYNLTITSMKGINATYSACLYLFANGTQYKNFLGNNGVVYYDSHCFTPAVTPGATSASHSFNIINAGQYYVGMELQSGISVQANASILRAYYNTAGLQQINCSATFTCSIDVCNTFICNQKATTYFLVKPSNKIIIFYFFTSPQLHGSIYGGFITIVVLGSLCCCFNCIWLCCFTYCSRSSSTHNYHLLKSPRAMQSKNMTAQSFLSKSDIEFSQSFEPDSDKELFIHRAFLSKSKNEESFNSTDDATSDGIVQLHFASQHSPHSPRITLKGKVSLIDLLTMFIHFVLCIGHTSTQSNSTIKTSFKSETIPHFDIDTCQSYSTVMETCQLSDVCQLHTPVVERGEA